MRSGDRPGLQNRRVASSGVTGGFDPHSLPPILEVPRLRSGFRQQAPSRLLTETPFTPANRLKFDTHSLAPTKSAETRG